MAEVDPCAELKPVDDLLEWWTANRHGVCQENLRMAKKYDDITKRIANYHRKVRRILSLRHILKQRDVPSIDDLRQRHPDLTRKFGAAQDNFELRGDVERELERLQTGGDDGGVVAQALVTRWFHEAGFRIIDIEVEHKDSKCGKHTFDINIEDVNGHGWDVEVWHGTGPLAHEEQRVKARVFFVGGKWYRDPGKWDPSMKYITKLGGIGDDSEANFHTLTAKMGQMRKGRMGLITKLIDIQCACA